jgi:hypothetical protein
MDDKPEDNNNQMPRSRNMTVRIGKLTDDQDWEYMQYFLSRPVEERVSAMEELRKAMHGENYATECRLSRSSLRAQFRKR